MNVAVVRLPDGQLRTIKLSQIQSTQPRAAVPHVPIMGRNMTQDSPAVRKVQTESEPVPGQIPQVKVKQEPPQVKAELARPPAPVNAEEAARIGQPDPESGRPILQPSNDAIQNERLANQAAPDLTTRLSRIAASVPEAKLDRLRPQKGLERLQEKVASGKPPRTIGDNLAAQIVAKTVEAKDQLIQRLHEEFTVISVDDKFTQPREKAGYPSANIQVQMPNGATAEVQIVTPEVQAITDQTHALYTAGRRFPEGSADRAWYWNEAARMHQQALERFKARTGSAAPPQLSVGQQVVLRNGEPGKIVSFQPKFNRIVVETTNGLKTVRPGEMTLARPHRTRSPQPPPLQLTDEQARQLRWEVVRAGGNLPPYLEVNETTNSVLNHVTGTEGVGVSANPYSAYKSAASLERVAEQQESPFARQRVQNLAAAVREAIDPLQGLNVAQRTSDLPEHVDTVSEELFHSLSREVPVEELADHRHLQPMRRRIERETGKTDDFTIVGEAMNDVAMGEVPELTPEQAEEFARDMWQAMAKYHGPEILEQFSEWYEYYDVLRREMGVTLNERRRMYVERARHALEQVRHRIRDAASQPGVHFGRRGKGAKNR